MWSESHVDILKGVLGPASHSDLKDVSTSDPARKKALADAVRDACINVGFLYGESYLSLFGPLIALVSPLRYVVKNHGIPEDVVNNALSASKQFFSLPLDHKEELDIRKTSNFKGYTALLSSNNDPDNAGDMHEGFEFGWEEMQAKEFDEKRANDGAMAGANVWPRDLPGFRKDVLTY